MFMTIAIKSLELVSMTEIHVTGSDKSIEVYMSEPMIITQQVSTDNILEINYDTRFVSVQYNGWNYRGEFLCVEMIDHR